MNSIFKFLFCLVLMMIFFTNCSEDKHRYREVKRGGMLDSIIEYEGGMQKGMIICYYPDGKTIKWSERTDGDMPIGVQVFYYPSGRISDYASNGGKFGIWYVKNFYENGFLKSIHCHFFSKKSGSIGTVYDYYRNGAMHRYNCLTYDGECMYVILKVLLNNEHFIKEIIVNINVVVIVV